MSWKLYCRGKQIEDSIDLQNILCEQAPVFETLRTYGKHIFRFEEHLDRLMESAKTSGFVLNRKRSELKREMKGALKAYQQDYGTQSDVWIRVTFCLKKVLVMIRARSLSKNIYSKGVALKTSPVRRSLSNASFPEVKSSAYQNSVLAHLEPKSEGIYEWIFLDQNGHVTEVSVGNLFMIKNVGARRAVPLLATPPTTGILNGVTRQFVVECALQAGVSVTEIPLTRHDLYNASEVFLTNTSWEILPVCSIDGRKIGPGVPGKQTQWLHKQFHKKVKRECP